MPTARLQRSLRATFLGLAANVTLTVAKFLAGFFGHSQALIADAVESLADIFSSIIVWRGLVVAETPPDEDHPYGHGKAEPLAAAMVSAMLLLAAGMIAFHSLKGIIEPRVAPSAWTLIVLVIVIAVKETLFRFVLRESETVSSSAVETDAWHHRSDAITSAAAFIGISIALVGGPGYEQADNWAALVAACVIAWNGWRLLRPAFNELMDRSPDRELIEKIRAVAGTIPGVAGVEKCFVRKMGYQFFVDMHIEVDPQMTVENSHHIGHEVKDKVRAEIPSVRDVLVHIEPLGIPAKKIFGVKPETHFKGWAKPGPIPPGLGDEGVAATETLDAISGHFRLFQLRDGHRFSTDDILTAWYGTTWCPTARTALDLGSGIGTVGMICAWRLPGAKFVTVEVQAESVALAKKSARYNGVTDRYEIREGDFRSPEILRADEKFDLVTGSPPYFPLGDGVQSEHPQKLACRFELRGNIDDYCAAAVKHLAPGGFFVCVFPHEPAQLARVVAAAKKSGLVIVRKRPVVFREGDPALIALFGLMRADDLPEWFRGETWTEPELIVRTRAGKIHPEYSAVKLAIGFPP